MRILLITYFFKPVQNVCADRPNSLFKYSHNSGVTIDVITTGSPLPGDEDENIIRLENIDGWNKRPFSLKKMAAKILTKIVAPFFFNIDFFWYSHVVAKCKKLISNRHYDAIYAVFPHITDIIIGLRLSKKYNIPLFTDFTDCIGLDPLFPPTHFIQKKFQLSFEKTALHKSMGVFTIAEAYERYYRECLHKAAAWNVYNGFDPDDYKGLATKENNNRKVVVVLFGNICASRERDVTPLFSAIAKLKSDRAVSANDIEFLFIGRHTESERNAMKKSQVDDIVRFVDFMDKRDGFKFITESCDYLLHYGVDGASSSVCSKLLEYLRLNKPILGICKGNEAEGIINRAGAGEVASFSTESISLLLQHALDRKIHYNPDYNYIESFSRESQARFIFERIKECLLNR
jgi:glycosyltransferase involved in cell wall biosynthesis